MAEITLTPEARQAARKIIVAEVARFGATLNGSKSMILMDEMALAALTVTELQGMADRIVAIVAAN